MRSQITRDVLESYLHCKYKAWLKLSGEEGSKSDYETLLMESKTDVRFAAVERILAQNPNDEVAQDVSLNASILKQGHLVILNAVLENHAGSFLFDGLKRVPGASKLGDYHYIPMLFHDRRQVRREHRLLVELYGLFLSMLQEKVPGSGIIWHGQDSRATRVHFAHGLSKAEEVLRELKDMEDSQSLPRLTLNDHCQIDGKDVIGLAYAVVSDCWNQGFAHGNCSGQLGDRLQTARLF